jgi:hypothetical protein
MKVFSPDETGCLCGATSSLTGWGMLLKDQKKLFSCNNFIKFTLENLSSWELEFCGYIRDWMLSL